MKIEHGFEGYRGADRNATEKSDTGEPLAQLADENYALFENSPNVMMSFDDAGRMLRANAVGLRTTGYELQDLAGHQHLEFVTAETRCQTHAAWCLLQGGQEKATEFDNSWLRKNGGVVHLSWVLWRSADNMRTYATAREMTEVNQVRTELQRTHVRQRAILEGFGGAFFSLDKDWRVTYANPVAAEFIGVDRDAAIGKLVWDVAPDIVRSTVFPHYQRAMETGENTFFEEYYEPVGAWVDVRVYAHDDGLSIFFHDVSVQRQKDRTIRESELRFREMIEITPAGYVATDGKGIVVDVNPALCLITGYQREEFVGHDILEFLPSCPVNGALKVKGGISAVHGKETLISHKSGHTVPVLTNLSIKRDTDGNGIGLTAFVTDITERKKVEAEFQHLATHDTLTGLPNREFINKHLQALLQPGHRNESITVLFIDLDRFKEVNDSMGHGAGDSLLRQAGKRFQNSVRPGDIVARLGGDEFVVATRCPEGERSAAAIAGKLLAALEAPFEIDGQEVHTSASIGISMATEDAQTAELLFRNADMAMYRAKGSGRNNYCFFEAEMSIEAKTRMALEHALPRALARGEFELHYQPRVSLRTMTAVGMEALIRWNHPELGRIPPLQFIPIAEERGFIEAIGQWVLEEACLQTVGLATVVGRPLHVSVNLSARQLKCPTIVEQVEQALAKSGLAPELLELELTESALIEDMDKSVEVLNRLKKLGILLSVDDFGTGYSGLSYLKRFPVDILKLDRSFVLEQSNGVDRFDFIKAFVDMAHALKLSVVAEGIETDEVLQLLIDTRCDEGQGYFLCKPAVIKEVRDYFASFASIH